LKERTGRSYSIKGDVVQIMDNADYSTLELKIPDELKGKIEAAKIFPISFRWEK